MAGGLRNEVELFTRWGWVLPPRTPLTGRPAYGYNIRRQMLDPIVRRAAVATSGVDFMPGFSARELPTGLGKVQALSRGLAAYGRRHRRELAGHEFLISDFSTGRRYNPLERLMFSAAARHPICADHLAAFGDRCIGVSAFLRPSALMRAMWINARHAAGAHASG
jgi:hypothetical protein